MEFLQRNKGVVIASGVIILLLGWWEIAVAPSQSPNQISSLSINEHSLVVDIADTPVEQARGLSNRDSLAPGTGLLFIYQSATQVSFWMKDMRFDLDIIWIKDQQVVGLVENVPADQVIPLPTYASPGPINWVLEINAGEAKHYNIQVGDRITLER